MEVRKSRFENCTKEEKRVYLARLKQRIKSGYMDSEKVMASLAEKLVGTFDEELARY